MSPRRATGVALGAAGLVVACHEAPGLASIAPLRRALFARLSGRGRPDHLALTFDDGPDPSSTPAFLDALSRLGWRATFFMLGTMVRRAPGLAREVVAAGHEVALHGEQHRSHLLRPPGAVMEDMIMGASAIEEATGVRPRWHRPPYGALSGATILGARRLGLDLVLWSAWGRDWRAAADPESVMADLGKGLGPGGTVLLHDSDCTSAPGAWRSALGALELLAERAGAQGWTVGPLADHGIDGCPGARAVHSSR